MSDEAQPSPQPEPNLRSQGNEAFQRGAFSDAVRLYSLALSSPRSSDPQLPRILANRSAAHLALGDAAAALEDAERARAGDAAWHKVYVRQAAALQALERPFAALQTYEAALSDAELSLAERKWFLKRVRESREAFALQSTTARPECTEAFLAGFSTLRDMRFRLCHLATFWNFLGPEERHSALGRFQRLLGGQGQLPPPEELRDLPLTNYEDVEVVDVWMRFFKDCDVAARLDVLEGIWHALSEREKGLVLQDLQHFLLKPPGPEAEVEEAEGEGSAA